jgi:T5SS/PEP-CTERM-associated repeat protein
MVISNEATVLTTNLVVGGGGSLGNTLQITGSNTVLNASGTLTIGDSSSPGSSGAVIGGSSTVTISDGAVVTAPSVILGGAGSTNVSLLVTGNGSALNFGSVTVGDSTNTSAGTIGGSATLTVGTGAVLGGNAMAPVILAAGTNSTGTLNFGTPGGSETGLVENQTAMVFGDGTSLITFNQSDTFTNRGGFASLAYYNTFTPAPSPTAMGAIIQQGSGTTIFYQSFMSTFPADNLYAQLLVLNGALEIKSSQVNLIANSSSPDMGGVFVGYQGSNSMGYFSNSAPVSLAVNQAAYLFSSYVEVGHGYDLNGNPTGQNNSNSLIVTSGDNGLRLGNLIVGNGGSYNTMELSQGSTVVFDTSYATNSNAMGAIIGNYGNSNSMVVSNAQFNGFALYGGDGYAMTVGNHGNGNILMMAGNFGAIGVSNTVVGNQGEGNLVLLDGGYNQYLDLGSFMIGHGAGSSNNGLIVTNGASLGVASNLYVGVSNNANYLQVTGYDSSFGMASTLTVTNDLVVGFHGVSNSATISQGAGVGVGRDFVVGLSNNANSLLVTGYDASSGTVSTLNVTNNLAVGYYGNGNSATISDGAAVNVLGAVNVGVGGNNNTLTIGNAGSLVSGGAVTVTAGNTLGGSGTLTAPSVAMGGTLSPVGTNSLTINGNLGFASSSTYLWSLFASTTSGPGTNFTAPLILNGALSVTNGATFAINLTNSVSSTDSLWTNYGVIQSWVLMTNTAGSSMSQGTNFTLSFVFSGAVLLLRQNLFQPSLHSFRPPDFFPVVYAYGPRD